MVFLSGSGPSHLGEHLHLWAKFPIGERLYFRTNAFTFGRASSRRAEGVRRSVEACRRSRRGSRHDHGAHGTRKGRRTGNNAWFRCLERTYGSASLRHPARAREELGCVVPCSKHEPLLAGWRCSGRFSPEAARLRRLDWPIRIEQTASKCLVKQRRHCGPLILGDLAEDCMRRGVHEKHMTSLGNSEES